MNRSTTILALGSALLWGAGCVSVTFTDVPGQGGAGGANVGGGDVISAGGAGGAGGVNAGGGGGAGGAVPPKPVTAIAAGGDTTCAVRGGKVYCWGRDPLTGASLPTPTLVPDLSGSTQLALGAKHGCALKADTVLCWGQNDLGQLGQASKLGGGLVAVSVPAASRVVAGEAFSCALTTDGAVYCWGSSEQGGGMGSTVEAPPAPLSLAGVIELAAGDRHVCAITAPDPVANGDSGAYAVWCWGDNSPLQLGVKEVIPSKGPIQLALSGGVLAELALGATHSCLRVDKTVNCWGDNKDGQLGEQVISREPTWVPQKQQTAFERIAAGGDRSCGWIGNEVKCWGLRYDDEQTISAWKLKEMAIGARHSCILTEGGEVLCWGSNNEGQLGVGDSDRPEPTLVAW